MSVEEYVFISQKKAWDPRIYNILSQLIPNLLKDNKPKSETALLATHERSGMKIWNDGPCQFSEIKKWYTYLNQQQKHSNILK